jgi:hypothetical protein
MLLRRTTTRRTMRTPQAVIPRRQWKMTRAIRTVKLYQEHPLKVPVVVEVLLSDKASDC